MRKVHEELHGTGWTVVKGPFMKKINKTKFKLNEVPWAYIENLKSHVMDRISALEEYVNFYNFKQLY